jgi:hypothetical protein
MNEDKRQEDALQEVVDFVMGWNAEHALMALGQAAATIIVYMTTQEPWILGTSPEIERIHAWFISNLSESITQIIKTHPQCPTHLN